MVQPHQLLRLHGFISICTPHNIGTMTSAILSGKAQRLMVPPETVDPLLEPTPYCLDFTWWDCTATVTVCCSWRNCARPSWGTFSTSWPGLRWIWTWSGCGRPPLADPVPKFPADSWDPSPKTAPANRSRSSWRTVIGLDIRAFVGLGMPLRKDAGTVETP